MPSVKNPTRPKIMIKKFILVFTLLTTLNCFSQTNKKEWWWYLGEVDNTVKMYKIKDGQNVCYLARFWTTNVVSLSCFVGN